MKKYNSRNCYKSNKFLVTDHNEIEKFPLWRLYPHGILTHLLLCSNLPPKLNQSRTSFIYPQLTDHMSFTNPVIDDSTRHTHSHVHKYPHTLSFPLTEPRGIARLAANFIEFPSIIRFRPLLPAAERESERERLWKWACSFSYRTHPPLDRVLLLLLCRSSSSRYIYVCLPLHFLRASRYRAYLVCREEDNAISHRQKNGVRRALCGRTAAKVPRRGLAGVD